jgi:Tfp pilus assembly protein PilN
MRAVNLIPAESRRGSGGGQSGLMVYLLLGALAVVLVGSLGYALANKSVNDRRTELADVRAKADAAQSRAEALQAYVRFADLRAKRVQTVTQLVQGRFDWAHTLREVSRVIPENSWLTSLKGSTTGGTSPTVDITGCTTSQKSVARMMARMRLIDGVQGVALGSSDKSGCGTSEQHPQFQMTLAFRPTVAAAPTSPSTATSPQGATP